jgi:parvulin-like peptidyl-prolyl isomerase
MTDKKAKIIRINKVQLKKVAWISLYVLVFVLALLIILAYGLGSNNAFARGISKTFRLPAAFVGSQTVALSDYYDSLALANKATETKVSRKKVLEQMVENRVALRLSKEQELLPTADELEQSYQDIILLTGESVPESRYDLRKVDFLEFVVKPSVVHTKLAIKLAADDTVNGDVYQKVSSTKQELANGAKFEDLARKYSDDALSSQIGGDLGFVTARDLVPEYYREVANTKDDEVHTITTRHGVYLYMLVGRDESNGSTRYRVKHIYFKTKDYDQWLKNEVKKFNILKLV